MNSEKAVFLLGMGLIHVQMACSSYKDRHPLTSQSTKTIYRELRVFNTPAANLGPGITWESRRTLNQYATKIRQIIANPQPHSTIITIANKTKQNITKKRNKMLQIQSSFRFPDPRMYPSWAWINQNHSRCSGLTPMTWQCTKATTKNSVLNTIHSRFKSVEQD